MPVFRGNAGDGPFTRPMTDDELGEERGRREAKQEAEHNAEVDRITKAIMVSLDDADMLAAVELRVRAQFAERRSRSALQLASFAMVFSLVSLGLALYPTFKRLLENP